MGKYFEQIMKQNTQGPHDVFLSYRSSHVDFVSRLNYELYDNHINVWYDKDILHENVGKEYAKIIHEGIRNSKLFLLIYTKDIETSGFILNEELRYAIREGKPVFCYAKDPVDFDKMSPEFSSLLKDRQLLENENSVTNIRQYQDAIMGERKRAVMAESVHDTSKHFSVFDDINLFLIRIEVQRRLGHSTAYGNYKELCKSESTYEWDEISISVIDKAFYIEIPEKKKEGLKKRNFMTPIKEEDKKIDDEMKLLLERINPDKEEIKNNLMGFIKKNYLLSDIYMWLSTNRKSYLSCPLDDFSIKRFIDIVANITADNFMSQIDDKSYRKTLFNGSMTGVYEVSDERSPDVERHLLTMRMYYTDYFTFKSMVEMYHILCSVKDVFKNIDKSNINTYAAFLSSLGLGGFVITSQPKALSLMWAKRSDNIASGDMWHFSYDETSNIVKDGVRDANGQLVVVDNMVKIDVLKYFHRALWEEVGVKDYELETQKGVIELGLIKSERLEVELLSYAVLDLPSEPSLSMQMAEFRKNASDAYLENKEYKYVPLSEADLKLVGLLLSPEALYLSKRMYTLMLDYGSVIGDGFQRGDHVRIGAKVQIGKECLIEDYSRIGDGCVIGDYCRIHRNVHIGDGVRIGNKVKIQNNNSIYEGVELEDGVFVGTNVCFINDRHPRAIMRDGSVIGPGDWKMGKTRVCYGASIGAGAVIMCGEDKELTIGEWAMVAAGSVVLENVPAGAMVAGNPAKMIKTNVDY